MIYHDRLGGKILSTPRINKIKPHLIAFRFLIWRKMENNCIIHNAQNWLLDVK